jgi:flagellar biosynthesis GTPase FlhF
MKKRLIKYPQNPEHDLKGLVGSAIFHALLIAFFVFVGIKNDPPLFAADEGVEVNLGTDLNVGNGDVQPLVPSPDPAPATPSPMPQENLEQPTPTPPVRPTKTTAPAPTPTQAEKILTQEQAEETARIQQAKTKAAQEAKRKEQAENEEKQRIENEQRAAEQKRAAAEAEKQRQIQAAKDRANKAYNKNKGNGTAGTGGGNTAPGGGSEGNKGTPGDQGDPRGNPDAKYKGIGGSSGTGTSGTGTGAKGGVGSGYDLSGRTRTVAPTITDDGQEEGKIVVRIWVDKAGSVLRAEAGAPGTSISSSTLQAKCKAAALRAKFNAAPDAPDEQRGTMTFVFKNQ